MATHLENEHELVRLAKQGDQQAFSTLVKHYEKNIYRLTLNFVRDPGLAEDLLQETFLRAYVKLDQFQGDSRFYTWLVRIAVNFALMELRQRRRSGKFVSLDEPVEADGEALPRDIEDWGRNPEEQYSHAELQQILEVALARLDPSYRAVVLLRDLEGYSTEEAAAMLQLSISATKSRLLRGRLQLRELLNDHFRPARAQEESGTGEESGAEPPGLLPKLLPVRTP